MDLTGLYERWLKDLPAYCRSALIIHAKGERGFVPLHLNHVQKALHAALERQKAETGRVRALILKCRQCGVSTYTAARIFRDIHLRPDPVRAYVLAQDDEIAKHQKRMYATFWEQHDQNLRRARSKSNDHMEEYAHGSYVTVNTASTVTGGFGGTIERFHGTELSRWAHADEHAAGAMQQLSKLPGTESILESTARGATGAFYERWRAAKQGASEYMPLFFPWTMMPEYSEPQGTSFSPSHERPNDLVPSEYDYQRKHGCTNEQMAWRRAKIQEFQETGQDGALKFAREYPADDVEAWLSGGEEAFISPVHVEAARTRNAPLVGLALRHPMVMGVDPSPAHGGAASAIIRRRGRIAYDLERLRGLEPERLLMAIYERAIAEDAMRIYIDESEGVGHYLVTALRGMTGMGGRVIGIQFGGQAFDTVRYHNVRAEIWSRGAIWLANGATIPDERSAPGQQTLASELVSVHRKEDEKRVLLESKAQMRQRGVPSPDGADALMATFYYPDPDPMGATGNVGAPLPFDDDRPRVYSRFGDAPDGNIVVPMGSI